MHRHAGWLSVFQPAEVSYSCEFVVGLFSTPGIWRANKKSCPSCKACLICFDRIDTVNRIDE